MSELQSSNMSDPELSSPVSISKIEGSLNGSEVVVNTIQTASNKSEMSESDDFPPEEFPKLSYIDVEVNLRLLTDVKEGEKIMISENKRTMLIDQRYVQPFRRYWSSDSRQRTLTFIHHVINNAKNYCNEAVGSIRNNYEREDNMRKLIKLQGLLRTAAAGLGRLQITYGYDKQNKATIDTFIDTVQVFCDQDLKKAIN